MPDTLEGFPFWILSFDENAALRDASAESRLADEVGRENLTDLFIFSHGWNNEPSAAKSLYQAFFAQVRKLLSDPSLAPRRDSKIGVCGIIWPSVAWPDESPLAATGGAASLGGGSTDPFPELRRAFTAQAQLSALDDLQKLLTEKKRNEGALQTFLDRLGDLAKAETASAPADATDTVELRGVNDTRANWREMLQVLAEGEESDDSGGAAGLGDKFAQLWSGAKGALRVTSYWIMKDRAGNVGRNALGPLIARLHSRFDKLRVHLIGHSFGARLVSFSLAGLPAGAVGAQSPVKSVLLLQGAFSHFAFADALPFDSRRSGELKGMAARVDGPLIATHSLKDLAVGRAYPLASLLARQDAAAAQPDRWGAVGNDGFQAVNAAAALLGKPGTVYDLKPGRWLNLDGNRVIVNGGLPSGAHSDIIHPHTAWAALAAAGLR
jgi:hypothetical protein